MVIETGNTHKDGAKLDVLLNPPKVARSSGSVSRNFVIISVASNPRSPREHRKRPSLTDGLNLKVYLRTWFSG